MQAPPNKAPKRKVSQPPVFFHKSFMIALNELGQFQFNGLLSFAIYRNSQAVDHELQKFFKKSGNLLRSHTEHDGKGNVLMVTAPDGRGQTAKFRSPEDEKIYHTLHNQMYQQENITVELITVPEAQIEEAMLNMHESERIQPNVLNALRPMFLTAQDEEAEQERMDEEAAKKATAPGGAMEVVRDQDVPSGSTSDNDGNDPLGTGTGEQVLPPAAQEPSGSGVLEQPEPADHPRNG